MTYLLDSNLLSDKRYGFIKGISTMLQLLHMLDKWTEYLENGGQIDVTVFIVILKRPLIRYFTDDYFPAYYGASRLGFIAICFK